MKNKASAQDIFMLVILAGVALVVVGCFLAGGGF